jgi:hypothetical protein
MWARNIDHLTGPCNLPAKLTNTCNFSIDIEGFMEKKIHMSKIKLFGKSRKTFLAPE